MVGHKSNKANALKKERFKRQHPEGRKVYSLRTKQKRLEQQLDGVKFRLKNLGKE